MQRLPASPEYSAAGFWALGGMPDGYRQPSFGYCTVRAPTYACTTTLRRSFVGQGRSPVAGATTYGPEGANSLRIVPEIWVEVRRQAGTRRPES